MPTDDTRGSVAVIIPTRDRAAMLRESLQAMRAQTRTIDRLIVVDDGSVDGTRDVASEFDPDVLIRLDGVGKAAAVNRAMLEAQCDYVWIFDDDDWAAPTAVERLAGALDKERAYGFSFGYPEYAETDSTGAIVRRWPMSSVEEIESRGILAALLEKCFIGGPCALYRRSTLEKVGPLNETLLRSEDYEYIVRTARLFSGIGITDAPIFTSRRHNGVRVEGSSAAEPTDRIGRFLQLEQPLFREFRKELRLDEYLKLPDGQVPSRQALLLQRAGAMASKLLYDEMLEDLRELASLPGDGRLSRLERGIVHRMLFERPYEVAQLVEQQDILAETSSLARHSAVIRSVWAYAVTRLARECLFNRQSISVAQRKVYQAAMRTLIGENVSLTLRHGSALIHALRTRGSSA